MAYAFSLTDDSLQDALRRIASEGVSRIITQLEPHAPLAPVAVHDIRKDIKKLRALLRLVRHGMAGQQSAENIILRDAGRLLAHQRDGAVRLATFDRLMGADPAPALAPLRDHLAQAAANPPPPPPDLLPTFTALRDRIDTWELHGTDRRILAEGLAETRSRARRAMQHARDDRGMEAMHDWRKRAKDHWYQARLLSPIWPEVMRPISAAADRLGEALGDHHDLGVLADTVAVLADTVAPPEARADLLTRATEAQQALESTSFALGARLFAGNPEEMADLWLRWWKAWRAERSAD